MIRRLSVLASAVALAGAMPAIAATTVTNTYAFDFTSASNTATSGNAGNSYSWTTNVNGQAITVTATAWNATMITSGSNKNKYQITSAYLGRYEGGLGVTSAANDDLNYDKCNTGDCNTHQVDNMGNNANSSSIDFIRLTFSSPVTLGSVTLNAYLGMGADMNSLSVDDDFSYGKTGATAMSNGLVVSSLSSIFSTSVNSAGYCDYDSNYSCNDTTQLSTAGQATASTAAKDWYIGASITPNYGGDGNVDSFKVAGVSSYAVQSAVPEPGTWTMMILGFGAIGHTMRSRKRETKDARGL